MNEEIIDMHTHLGNILYPGGGGLIEKTGQKKAIRFDIITISEKMLHFDLGDKKMEKILFGKYITIAERARNLTATRENMRRSMDENGIVASAVMPVPPNVLFSDLFRAAGKDKGILPFTGIDFSQSSDAIDSQLAADVNAGARGLKLHPVIQKEKLTSAKTFSAMESFMRYNLPVLCHSGTSSYYPKSEHFMEEPSYGEIFYIRNLARAFPGVCFIVGHSGLYEVEDAINMLHPYQNIYMEISFQNPWTIRRLIRTFGPDRILYGTDWPWGDRRTALKCVQLACGKDRQLARRILYENAAELLCINL
jgi:predicted TIM-barrel fold metal-dependent hydrolase